MLPAAHPLDLYRGDTFSLAVRVWVDAGMTLPADLAGATAAAELRAGPLDTFIVAASCTIAAPATINLRIEASDWPAAAPEQARWDLQLTYPDGSVRTILAGPARILDDVTVPA